MNISKTATSRFFSLRRLTQKSAKILQLIIQFFIHMLSNRALRHNWIYDSLCVALNSFIIMSELNFSEKRRIRRPTGSAAAKIAEKNSLRNVTSRSTSSVKKEAQDRSSSSVKKEAQDRSDLAPAPSTNRFKVRARKRPGVLAASATSTDVAVSSVKENKKDKDGYKIVCYYTNWSQYRVKIGKFLPEDIPADLCTHIIFAFGWLKKGKLSSFESNDETKDGKIGLYSRILGLKKANPSLKILLAIGGWSFGTQKFKEMSGTRYARQTFIYSAIPYLRQRGFDGKIRILIILVQFITFY